MNDVMQEQRVSCPWTNAAMFAAIAALCVTAARSAEPIPALAPMAEATSASAPVNAFATDHPDGSRYMTFYNFSAEKPCAFRIPTGGHGKIMAEETLVPNGLEIGCRYARRDGAGKVVGDFYELTLPPACQAAVLLKNKKDD